MKDKNMYGIKAEKCYEESLNNILNNERLKELLDVIIGNIHVATSKGITCTQVTSLKYYTPFEIASIKIFLEGRGFKVKLLYLDLRQSIIEVKWDQT